MPKIDLFGGKRSLMMVTPLKERERRSTWKDGGKDTQVIQLKTAFIEIDGQPMMMMMTVIMLYHSLQYPCMVRLCRKVNERIWFHAISRFHLGFYKSFAIFEANQDNYLIKVLQTTLFIFFSVS